MKLTRRTALQLLATTAAATPEPPQPSPATRLNWLDRTPPALTSGVSWGVPWPRGTVRREQTFSLGNLPLQSWPLAYWPDGSIKFTAFATVAGSTSTNANLTTGTPAAP